MKKILLSLVLLLAGQVIYAQNLNQLMNEMANVENAQRQAMDREMLSNMPKSGMPDFMNKADSVVAIILQSCPEELSTKFSAEINAAEKSEDYETLVAVKKENNIVSILLSKNESDIKDIYIYVMGGRGATVFVKMSGKFTTEDIENIVKEQQNDND